MYQSIRILQLVFPISRAPQHHLHDKKGHLQLVTKLPKSLYENNFFVTSRISSKLNHNKKGNVLPTLIQFHDHRTSIVQGTFNRNSGNFWHKGSVRKSVNLQIIKVFVEQPQLHKGVLIIPLTSLTITVS